MIELEKAKAHLEALELSEAANVLESRLELAAKNQSTYAGFLADLLGAEVGARRTRYIAARTRLAHLPFQKSIEQFDFSFQPSVDRRQIQELYTLAFVHEAHNVIFLGPPGVGKTHLAVAIAMEAVRSGIAAYFVTANALVDDLKRAYQENRLERRMRVYLAPKLLIIDEMGYLPLDNLAATMLFQLVSMRYERGSIILTSNKSFGNRGEVFGDPVIAGAILDRLLHHSYIVNIKGESYRLREKKRAGVFSGPYSTTPGTDSH